MRTPVHIERAVLSMLLCLGVLLPLNSSADEQLFIDKGVCPGEKCNAVVESFFGLMKRERVNRTRYLTRDDAKAGIFDYIERFYNRKRRHDYLGNISPAAFEERNQNQFQMVH